MYLQNHNERVAEYAEIVHRPEGLPHWIAGVITNPYSNFCKCENDIKGDQQNSGNQNLCISIFLLF